MMVRWTNRAVTLWEQAFEFIESENSPAAHRIAERIIQITEMLAVHPFAGRPGRILGTREFPVPGSPFILAYGVDTPADTLWVYAVYHGRRRWPKNFPRARS